MEESDGTQSVAQPGHEAREGFSVLVLAGPNMGLEVACRPDGTLSVGVATGNAVVIQNPTVSRYHLELTPDPAGVRVEDLGSRNGTFVHGVRIDRGVVPFGSHLFIGRTELEVRAVVTARSRRREDPKPEHAGFIAESRAMRRVFASVQQLAPSMVSVLIEGETGTGKEVVARTLHELSPRAAQPFVFVDCGSLPSSLIASELFGHERGAFTGAHRRHAGAFERAAGGTLFLDEIGELPAELQPALLGVLERRSFRRLGGEEELTADVRLVSATHRDLRAATNTGAFRPDLYYRIAVARLVVPPLRDRPDDIVPLIHHFAEELTGSASMPFHPAQLEAFTTHHWAGNVRELRNVVEATLAMGNLEPTFTPPADARASGPLPPYKEARAQVVDAFEKNYLGQLIAASGGNASEAARRAQMDRTYLLSLLKRHGLR